MSEAEKKTPGYSPPGMLDFPAEVERLPDDHTLITDSGAWSGYGCEIIEVDRLGQIVWLFNEGLKFPHSAKRLENGNTLISDTGSNRVLEVDSKGNIVWTSDDWGKGTGHLSDNSHLFYPNQAKQLENGNILISDRNNDRILEVDRSGLVRWSYTNLKHPHGVERLANGHTIASNSDKHRIEEIDREGRVVWFYGGQGADLLGWPRDADRLPNGNTLITDSRHSRVIEIDPAGRIVWSYATSHRSQPFEADRLPNGNTLISDQQHKQVIEIDPAGNIVWCFRNFYRLFPIPGRLENADLEEELYPESGLPLGWIPCNLESEGGGKLTWDSNVSFKGKHSLKIEYDRNGMVWWQQSVRVSPGKTYRLSCWVKTQGFDSGFAQLQLAFVDQMGGFIDSVHHLPSGIAHRGIRDWTKDEFEARAPEIATSADIRCFVTGKGNVWFDDFSFFEIPWV